MEVLDCSAILLSLFMNQSKTASNIMFMLDLGNHLDQWSLKKNCNRFRTESSCKRERCIPSTGRYGC